MFIVKYFIGVTKPHEELVIIFLFFYVSVSLCFCSKYLVALNLPRYYFKNLMTERKEPTDNWWFNLVWFPRTLSYWYSRYCLYSYFLYPKIFLTKLKILTTRCQKFELNLPAHFSSLIINLTVWKTEYLIAQLRTGIRQKVIRLKPCPQGDLQAQWEK